MMQAVTMTIIPNGERLLVRPIENATTTAGGLHLPDTSVEAPVRGTVIAAGHAYTGPIQPGDTVYYSRFAGTELTVSGETTLIIAQRDVLAYEKGPEAS